VRDREIRQSICAAKTALMRWASSGSDPKEKGLIEDLDQPFDFHV